MQDFLAEAAELISALDVDLVKLEAAAAGSDQSRELLNGIFRALHTIKGAAGFLNLQPLIRFAHAAEDALNKLRKGEVTVTSDIIDVLLQCVDVLRQMTGAMAANETPPECPLSLLEALHSISALSGGGEAEAAHAPAAAPAEPAQASSSNGLITSPLVLADEKRDLLEFMVADMQDTAARIEQELLSAQAAKIRNDHAVQLASLANELSRTLSFFGLDELGALVQDFRQAAEELPNLSTEAPEAGQLIARLRGVNHLITLQAGELSHGRKLTVPLTTLSERIKLLASHQSLPAPIADKPQQDVPSVLALDGVMQAPAESVAAPTAAAPSASAADEQNRRKNSDRRQIEDRRVLARRTDDTTADSTIRVEVARLEALLNLVGQLVLNKNRFLGLSRRLRAGQTAHEMLEEVASAANELDRLTSSLQVGVMRTRMQPMAKLFERYPRVIRDIARANGKEIQLEVIGKETEVDKAVLELLADPLVHLLRNSADHGIEKPEARTQLGKPATGTIQLRAEHQGNHVRIEVTDDGKGLDRELLGRKAIEKGLTTPEQLATLTEAQVFQFIFAAGFSTAEKVSDLSGRGVGMDVVKTNIARMGGSLNLRSTKGQGTSIEILIPLTVAIMPAMVVGVGKFLYAIPITSITEIVRPQESAMHTVGGQAVMRLRDSVMPLIDLHRRLGEHGSVTVGDKTGEEARRFAVVVRVGSQCAGLLVDRLVGQQEVVIKPLDDKYTAGGPFSGATIREDGEVSLILDVVRLVREPADGMLSAA
jgi:two-component system chemotaxis sensor kinase CheA